MHFYQIASWAISEFEIPAENGYLKVENSEV